MIHIDLKLKSKKLPKVRWNQFKIKNIFTLVTSGNSISKHHQIRGLVPYVSATEYNNGISNYINTNHIINNFIGVNGNGSIGLAFYHLHAHPSSDVKILKSNHLNIFTALFLCTCIHQQCLKYSYGLKLNCKRLDNLKINLPINNQDNPNWQFMENYIKSMIK